MYAEQQEQANSFVKPINGGYVSKFQLTQNYLQIQIDHPHQDQSYLCRYVYDVLTQNTKHHFPNLKHLFSFIRDNCFNQQFKIDRQKLVLQYKIGVNYGRVDFYFETKTQEQKDKSKEIKKAQKQCQKLKNTIILNQQKIAELEDLFQKNKQKEGSLKNNYQKEKQNFKKSQINLKNLERKSLADAQEFKKLENNNKKNQKIIVQLKSENKKLIEELDKREKQFQRLRKENQQLGKLPAQIKRLEDQIQKLKKNNDESKEKIQNFKALETEMKVKQKNLTQQNSSQNKQLEANVALCTKLIEEKKQIEQKNKEEIKKMQEVQAQQIIKLKQEKQEIQDQMEKIYDYVRDLTKQNSALREQTMKIKQQNNKIKKSVLKNESLLNMRQNQQIEENPRSLINTADYFENEPKQIQNVKDEILKKINSSLQKQPNAGEYIGIQFCKKKHCDLLKLMQEDSEYSRNQFLIHFIEVKVSMMSFMSSSKDLSERKKTYDYLQKIFRKVDKFIENHMRNAIIRNENDLKATITIVENHLERQYAELDGAVKDTISKYWKQNKIILKPRAFFKNIFLAIAPQLYGRK